jgi:hypothetical protein
MKVFQKDIQPLHFWLFLGALSTLLSVILFYVRSTLSENKSVMESYLAMMNPSSSSNESEEVKLKKKKINDLAFGAWFVMTMGHICFFIAFLLVLSCRMNK